MIPRIAAAYIRVSTDEQADQSPESQLVEIRKFAERNNYIVPDEFVFMDEGISGKKSQNRPAFQQMIGAAKEKPAPFDVILLWKFSRFARNQEESIVYKALLRKQCGVDVISVSEPLPGGPFATLIERIIEWFDEFYSIRLSQEVKRTMTVKANRGEFQSSPSFGYRAKIVPGEKTTLEPIPEEAEIIKEIFDRFLSGDGYYKIARILNERGIRTHRGNRFENRTIEYILRNPVYIGKLRWTPTGRARRNFNCTDTIVADASHEPIIEESVFASAQERVAKIKAEWGYKARPASELRDWSSGVVRCSECGGTLVFQTPHYMKCNNYAKGRCRSAQNIKTDLLHEAIISRLQEDICSESLHYSIERSEAKQNVELERLKATDADLQRRYERLLDAYLGGVIEIAQFSASKDAIEGDRRETQKKIEELEHRLSADDAIALLKEHIKATLETLMAPDIPPQNKNEALRGLAERIVFDKKGMTLDITYRIFL